MKNNRQLKDWLKFLTGIFILAVVFAFFSSGFTPPGVFGEVLRHNQKQNIDASPLFYSDLDIMPQLERGVRELRKDAALRAQ